MRAAEEQWWVDVLAPVSVIGSSAVSQQESVAPNANVEFGVPRLYVEEPDNMLFAQPADPIVMKLLMGDGQFCGQGDIQSVQRSRDIDTVMFEQDSWSSNQHQMCHHLGDKPPSRLTLPDHFTGGTFSSFLNSSVSLAPSIPNSDSHASFTSLPRALSLPSQLHDIPHNYPKGTGVSVLSTTTTPVASMSRPIGHPYLASSSFLDAMSVPPNASARGDCVAQSPLLGNSIYEDQLSQRNALTVDQTSLVMEERSVSMQGSLLSSPSSLYAVHLNFPSTTPAYHHQEPEEGFEHRGILQRSFSSLPSTASQNQRIKAPAMMSGDYLHQLSWNAGRMSPQWQKLAPLNRSLRATGERKRETINDRTLGALSPLSTVPGFCLGRPQDPGDSCEQVGVELKQEDVNLDTESIDGGVIPEGGLAIVNLLLRAAEAVDNGDAEMAKAILARLNQHISPSREQSIQRVAHYFREALETRIMGWENFVVQLSQDRVLHPLEEFHKVNAYVRFCEVSPYHKFAHFTANQAILETLEGEESIHIIDFQMGAGAQWASFLQDIACLRAAGKAVPTVRLTVVGTGADQIHATGANLCNFARLMSIALEFQAVVTRPECLEVSMFRLRDHEAVAVNFIFSLHELLDGDTSNGLATVLKAVLEARPKVVTTVEQEAYHSGPSFQQRFSEALQYYMFLFDSLTNPLEAGVDSSVNLSIESYLLAPEIMNIVACDGVARVKRHERLEHWRKRMLAARFHSRPLSEVSLLQSEILVTQLSSRSGFQVICDQGSLLLSWRGRPLLAASSWIC